MFLLLGSRVAFVGIFFFLIWLWRFQFLLELVLVFRLRPRLQPVLAVLENRRRRQILRSALAAQHQLEHRILAMFAAQAPLQIYRAERPTFIVKAAIGSPVAAWIGASP